MDNSYGLAELHEQLLIIMDDIDRVCRAHGIHYTVSDGTLLGAIRHKGFIPWDDDMDVRMLRNDFDKFRKAYETEKRPDFIVGHPCNLATYSVINPGYEIPWIQKREGTISNPWVTIMPMDCAPANPRISRMKATKMRILSGMMGKPPQYANFSDKAKRMWNITSFMGKVIGHRNAEKWFEHACVAGNTRKSDVLSSYTINSKGAYRRYPKYFFDKYMDVPYEDRTYMAIEAYHDYLTMAYGKDYMIPLPEKDRAPKHMSHD